MPAMNTLKTKLKRTAINRLLQEQHGAVTHTDWQRLGRSLDWRFKLIDSLALATRRQIITPAEMLQRVSGLVIIRQIEQELDQYQQGLSDLTTELATGGVDEGEFEQQLAALTAAILILAFLRGNGQTDEDNPLAISALLTLQTGGEVEPDLDLSGLPDEAIQQLQAELNIANESATALAMAIAAGEYTDNEAALSSRLAMWIATAAGVYALGQLFKGETVYYRWSYSPAKEHCSDCARLNDQVHTADEWRRSDWRPGSHRLGCGGWRCGCTLEETEGPSRGDF